MESAYYNIMIYHTWVRVYYTKSGGTRRGWQENRAVYNILFILYIPPPTRLCYLYIYIILRNPDGHKYSYRVIYYIVMIGGSANEDRRTYMCICHIYDGRRRIRLGDKNVWRLEFTASGRCGVRTLTRLTTTILL